MHKLVSITALGSLTLLAGCAVDMDEGLESSGEVVTKTQAMKRGGHHGPGHHGPGHPGPGHHGPGHPGPGHHGPGHHPGPSFPPALSRLFAPMPQKGSIEQFFELLRSHDFRDAGLIRKMSTMPQAVWLEQGSGAEVAKQARQVSWAARFQRALPVFVAYNIPFRDCAQYSAGGATTPEEYREWIDGVAEGIGTSPAMVILEPDGLGIIPHFTNLDGDLEWCQPSEADPDAAAAERFEMLNYAVDALKALPNVSVYLDGTHTGWLNVGDVSDRLVRGGVERADGFYLNASNYQLTANLTQYGTWISKCIAGGDYAGCANQYWNGGPEGTAIADLNGPWTGDALDTFGEWSDDSEDPTLNTSGINARFGDVEGGAHFVIDTSRNGQGPWTIDHEGDIQNWCNPPERGLGLPPTLKTGVDLLDAYLWIKTPGESDGECNRWEDAGEPDPVRGYVNPGAGDWFNEQALELVHNASPAL